MIFISTQRYHLYYKYSISGSNACTPLFSSSPSWFPANKKCGRNEKKEGWKGQRESKREKEGGGNVGINEKSSFDLQAWYFRGRWNEF